MKKKLTFKQKKLKKQKNFKKQFFRTGVEGVGKANFVSDSDLTKIHKVIR